jgi:hypothetical protein
MMESIITGVVVALITTMANFFLLGPMRRGQQLQDARIEKLSGRVVELEDVRLVGIAKVQEQSRADYIRLRDEIGVSIDKITRTVEAFVARMESGLEEARRGRASIHERINKEALSKNEFNARMDGVTVAMGRLEKSFTEAILVARDADRRVAHLEGQMEGKSL